MGSLSIQKAIKRFLPKVQVAYLLTRPPVLFDVTPDGHRLTLHPDQRAWGHRHNSGQASTFEKTENILKI